ncbi:hypothetical protein [uncultured Clostridium sp.]|nr:hypothetical protein [uncultured Clostridium sp.]
MEQEKVAEQRAIEERRRYYREYYKRNPDKRKKYIENYWKKKALGKENYK